MHLIDELFAAYDDTRACEELFAKARYGFSWSVEDGIIFLGSEVEYTSLVTTLLPKTLPEVPFVICNTTIDAFFHEAYAKYPNALLVVPEHSPDSIQVLLARYANQIPERAISRIIRLSNLADFLPVGNKKTKAFDIYRRSTIFTTKRNRKMIRDAYDLLYDNVSRSIFLQTLRRYLFAADTPTPLNSEKHYFDDVYTRRDDEVFVDCGGLDGDTLRDFLEENGADSFKEYIIYEPDSIALQQLHDYVGTLPDPLRSKVVVKPFAVSDQNGKVSFQAEGDGRSQITEEGNVTINAVMLDDQFSETLPTLIKMDIEGNELQALDGARRVIQEGRPVLIICLYHNPFDFWAIPLRIHLLAKDYNFVVRSYTPYLLDQICYAVPKERMSGE